MVFPKGYKRMKAYQHLIFDENEMICKIPKAVLLTNENDELKEMTYHFNNLLEKKNVSHILLNNGFDGHMGIIYKPYTEENSQVISEIRKYWNIN